jgi:hypothetical protein
VLPFAHVLDFFVNELSRCGCRPLTGSERALCAFDRFLLGHRFLQAALGTLRTCVDGSARCQPVGSPRPERRGFAEAARIPVVRMQNVNA